MKKTNRDTKRLSIETTTVRKLETKLTPDQLKNIVGGQGDPGMSSHAIC